MLVVGTAGHIDHGKSSIVKRLTDIDPDRLPEEKERGMTIDLGFAFYQTPDNNTVAFVDVPGHERFVKNMIAGAGGIDIVMLVIAADDGWMPQSQEHFQVVRLLDVKNGLIVINKVDLAESEEWVELLEEEVKDKVQGSFLENAPIFKVSAQTGQGFDELRNYLDNLYNTTTSSADINKARLYIDRSFIQQGIGGVVAGTLKSGQFMVGQNVAVWPSGAQGKIRTMQSNSASIETAFPGQRTAVSFTGIDREHLIRGGVITSLTDLSYHLDNQILALDVELIPEAVLALEDRRRVLLMIGTTEVEGELRMMDQKEIKPGESGIVFFKPDEPVYSFINDHYIMRLPTPMVTLGGGRVLDHLRYFPRRKNIDQYDYLKDRQSGQVDHIVLSELKKVVVAAPDDLLTYSDFSKDEIDKALETLKKQKAVEKYRGKVLAVETLEVLIKRFEDKISRFLKENPHLLGLKYEKISQILRIDESILRVLVDYLVFNQKLVRVGDMFNPAGRGVKLEGAVKKAHDDIIDILKDDPFNPPLMKKIAEKGKPYKDAIKYIIETREGYKCGSEFVFLTDTWFEIVRFIKEALINNDRLQVPEIRDRFGISRKFAIPILEETDRIRLTRRDGDFRMKGDRFESEEFNL